MNGVYNYTYSAIHADCQNSNPWNNSVLFLTFIVQREHLKSLFCTFTHLLWCAHWAFMPQPCKIILFLLIQWAITAEFCTPPPWKALLELGRKKDSQIHVPAKPYGRHFWNWISYPTDMPSIGGVQNSSEITQWLHCKSSWIITLF